MLLIWLSLHLNFSITSFFCLVKTGRISNEWKTKSWPTSYMHITRHQLWWERRHWKENRMRSEVTWLASSSLLAMFGGIETRMRLTLSLEGGNCRWSRSAKDKTTFSAMVSLTFWKIVNLSLHVFALLVKVAVLQKEIGSHQSS